MYSLAICMWELLFLRRAFAKHDALKIARYRHDDESLDEEADLSDGFELACGDGLEVSTEVATTLSSARQLGAEDMSIDDEYDRHVELMMTLDEPKFQATCMRMWGQDSPRRAVAAGPSPLATGRG